MSTVEDTINWGIDKVKEAVGFGSPEEQIWANLLLGILIIVSSSVGLVFMAVVLPLLAFLLVIGVLRLADPIDNLWPLGGGSSGTRGRR